MSIEILNVGGAISEQSIFTPKALKKQLPLQEGIAVQITQNRQTIANIIQRNDPRLLIVCGPCSIHDTMAAIEYGRRLKHLAVRVQDHIYIVMRVYFEKPRTSLGWKGFINDPKRNNSYDINAGLHDARSLLLILSELDLPLAMETLDPIIPLYLGDLISWAAIGARTSESQIHREMASGLPMPIGFKNGTNGNVDIAIHGMSTTAASHRFVGINDKGQLCTLTSTGNSNTHLILRGGLSPNYDKHTINCIETQLILAGLKPTLMIDCSHGNCNKDYRQQITVAKEVTNQILQGNRSIMGLMFESHLNPGNQSPYLPPEQLKYGVSVTDPCLGWQDTERVINDIAKALRHRALAAKPQVMLG